MTSYRRGNFSLKTLLLLVCGIAVLLASVGSGVQQSWRGRPWAGAIVDDIWLVGSLCVVGAVMGIFAGLLSARKLQGVLIGFFTGAMIGGVSGMHLVAPPNFQTLLVGCVLMILVSLILRCA